MDVSENKEIAKPKEEVKEEPPKEETIDLFKEEEVPKKIEVPEPIPKETAANYLTACFLNQFLNNYIYLQDLQIPKHMDPSAHPLRL